MQRLACILAAAAVPAAGAGSHGEVLGYLEDWLDVKWWDDNMPGKCQMGCFEPEPFLRKATPYSALNYGFTLLTDNPVPEQNECANKPNSTYPTGAGPCPTWGGGAIWLAQSYKAGAAAVRPGTAKLTPGMVAMLDAGRMAKMHPEGPKRLKLTLGGWSDWARMASVANAKKVAKLMAELVLWTHTDGVDLDMEHLSEFAQTIGGAGEFDAFNALILALRTELDAIKPRWHDFAAARITELEADLKRVPKWAKEEAGPYYYSTIGYLREVLKNDVPYFEISWTTRFNAFLPQDDPWNYLLPNSTRPKAHFITDYEGDKIFPVCGAAIDTVNIMAYDASGMALNFTAIMDNFITYGKVPAEKINIGFEPGTQASGTWEGLAADKQITQWAKARGIGGGMIWAVNEGSWCEKTAGMLAEVMQPTWRFGAAPVFTKCDPKTGMGPWNSTEA